jgi:hypothetical protein
MHAHSHEMLEKKEEQNRHSKDALIDNLMKINSRMEIATPLYSVV